MIFEQARRQEDHNLDVEGLVQRLRKERELANDGWQQLGRSNAAAWLETASYEELKGIAGATPPSSLDKCHLPRAAFRTMKQHMEEAKMSYEGSPASIYKTAWLAYVRAVWGQIKDEVEAADDGQHGDIESADGDASQVAASEAVTD